MIRINEWLHSSIESIHGTLKPIGPDVTVYLLTGSHYLNLQSQLMAIRSSSDFSHLRPGAFHITLQTDKTQHTQRKGWKKRRTNKQGLGLAPGAKRVMFGHFSVAFCASDGYHERVSDRNSHRATRNADSSSRDGWPGFWVHGSQLLA